MSPMISRTINIGIQEHSKNSTAISNSQLQSGSSRPLVVTGRVVGQPGKVWWHRAVYPYGHQKGHSVFCLGVGARGKIGNGGVADDGYGHGAEHHDSADSQAVREEGDGNW